MAINYASLLKEKEVLDIMNTFLIFLLVVMVGLVISKFPFKFSDREAFY